MERNDTLIRTRNLVISLAIFVALALYASTYSEPVLRVSLIPDESPSVVRRKLKPLTDYLEKKIGMKIEFRPMPDGGALVDALIDNKLDMVWFDGFGFIRVEARSKDMVIPLVQRAEDEKTRSVFVTRREDIRNLEDLKGKIFSFGAETSVSGHLMPRTYMQAAYIHPETDMQSVFSGTPEATLAAVASGKTDAGVLSNLALEKLIGQDLVDAKVVHVFFTTPDYHDYNWSVRADMDINLRLKLTDAFLALDKNVGLDKEILHLQHASKFIPAHAENYTVIESAARRAGLLK